MSFDKSKPAHGAPQASSDIRANFQSLASHHAGPTPPLDPEEGYTWADTASRQVKIFWQGDWRPWISFNGDGSVSVDGGQF
jgi:hypothetical protein